MPTCRALDDSLSILKMKATKTSFKVKINIFEVSYKMALHSVIKQELGLGCLEGHKQFTEGTIFTSDCKL